MGLFKCPTCNYITEKNSNMKRHRIKIHNYQETINIDESLNVKNNEENIETDKFKCDKCDKQLSCKKTLNNHIKICKGVKSALECHNCHEIFASRQSKAYHLNKCTLPPEPINEVIEESIKYKKTPIPQSLRKAVWNTYIGREIGETKCPVCKNSIISPFEFHCGHIVAEIKGGKTCLENLRPICKSCNSSMKTFNLETYQKQFFNNHIRE
jgi:hypothetical protein